MTEEGQDWHDNGAMDKNEEERNASDIANAPAIFVAGAFL